MITRGQPLRTTGIARPCGMETDQRNAPMCIYAQSGEDCCFFVSRVNLTEDGRVSGKHSKCASQHPRCRGLQHLSAADWAFHDGWENHPVSPSATPVLPHPRHLRCRSQKGNVSCICPNRGFTHGSIRNVANVAPQNLWGWPVSMKALLPDEPRLCYLELVYRLSDANYHDGTGPCW